MYKRDVIDQILPRQMTVQYINVYLLLSFHWVFCLFLLFCTQLLNIDKTGVSMMILESVGVTQRYTLLSVKWEAVEVSMPTDLFTTKE